MVKNQLKARGIKDKTVLKVLETIPREKFITEKDIEKAYEDTPLSIDYGQTISQPYMVAFMIEMLAVNAQDKILELGTGSGYQTAILASLGKEVYSIERKKELAQFAEKNLASLNYTNITIKVGDGSLGWEEYAPFDRIIISAGAPKLPRPLLQQLKVEGKIVAPLGTYYSQNVVRYSKKLSGGNEEKLSSCIFVPLIGKYGWKE